MRLLELLLELFDFVGFLLDQIVFTVELGLVTQALFLKELYAAVLLKQFLLHT